MPDALAEARRTIESRLTEIEDEVKRLRRAIKGLSPDSGPPRRRRGASRPRGRRRKARAPRGQRQEQFLSAVSKKPGAPVSEIAHEMGVAPQQLYSIATRLREQGRIKKQKQGYAVKR